MRALTAQQTLACCKDDRREYEPGCAPSDVAALTGGGELDEGMLRLLSGKEDLQGVSYLELAVDAEQMPINEMGAMLPSLRELKLTGSSLATLRDLGTQLTALRVLWIGRCAVAHLDGLGALPALRELYASFNDIADVGGVAELEELHTLDLEGNRVEADQLEWLAACASLRALTLEGNPVAVRQDYRSAVAGTVPQLEYIDDEPVTEADRHPTDKSAVAPSTPSLNSPLKVGTSGNSFSSVLGQDDDEEELARLEALERQMVGFGIKYAKMGIDSVVTLGELVAEGEGGIRAGDGLVSARPRTAGLRPGTPGGRPRTAFSAGSGGALSRPGTAARLQWEGTLDRKSLSAPLGSGASLLSRPGTALLSRPGTAGLRPSTAGGLAPQLDLGDDLDDDEEHGELSEVIAGAPTRALRRRRRGGEGGGGRACEGGGGGGAELAPLARGMGNAELLEQLCQWKMETQLMLEDEHGGADGGGDALSEVGSDGAFGADDFEAIGDDELDSPRGDGGDHSSGGDGGSDATGSPSEARIPTPPTAPKHPGGARPAPPPRPPGGGPPGGSGGRRPSRFRQ